MGGMARDSRELGGAWARFQTISYGEPSADLAPFVAHDAAQPVQALVPAPERGVDLAQ